MKWILLTLLVACGVDEMAGPRRPLRADVNPQRQLGALLAQYGPRNAITGPALNALRGDELLNTNAASPAVADTVYLRRIPLVDDDTPVYQVTPAQGSNIGQVQGVAIYRVAFIDNGRWLVLVASAFKTQSGVSPVVPIADPAGNNPVLLRTENYVVGVVTSAPAGAGVLHYVSAIGVGGSATIGGLVTQATGFPQKVALDDTATGVNYLGSGVGFAFPTRVVPAVFRGITVGGLEIP